MMHAYEKRSNSNRRLGGFTLLEIMVVLAIFGIAAILAFPALQIMLARARLETAVSQTASVLYSARFQAIRQSNTVQVEFEDGDDHRSVWASIDRDQNGDFESRIGDVQLGWTLKFVGPPTDVDATVGFVGDRVVFRDDGTVEVPGALRISGNVGNKVEYYEIRVAPAAAPRVQIRHWNPDSLKWVEEER
jgi:prepilin-type N-terminal cleavage/methylation domain-containing protein